jgi:hypothetical protein
LFQQTDNPAWDFQHLIPNYEVLKSYSLEVGTVLRPRCSRKEILEEFTKWNLTGPAL